MAWKVFVDDLMRWGQLGHKLVIMNKRVGADGFSVVQAFTMKSFRDGDFIADDEVTMRDNFGSEVDVRGLLQAMSDAAWEIGIKPKQIEDNRNELKATKGHLDDMRALVFKTGKP